MEQLCQLLELPRVLRQQRHGIKRQNDDVANHSSAGYSNLFCVGISHHTANVETRELYLPRGPGESLRTFRDLAQRKVLLLGAGEMSARTARALCARGVSDIRVSNRSFERAERLAASVQGRAIAFQRWPNECREIDILIRPRRRRNLCSRRKF